MLMNTSALYSLLLLLQTWTHELSQSFLTSNPTIILLRLLCNNARRRPAMCGMDRGYAVVKMLRCVNRYPFSRAADLFVFLSLEFISCSRVSHSRRSPFGGS